MESNVQIRNMSSEESIGRPTRYWRFFRRYPFLPLVIVVTIIIAAIFAPLLAPHDPLVGNLRHQDRPPFWQAESPISGKEGLTTFPLGTDPLGRDILSRIIWGARFSMIIAGIVIVTGAVGGTLLGMIAGYFGGLADEALMTIFLSGVSCQVYNNSICLFGGLNIHYLRLLKNRLLPLFWPTEFLLFILPRYTLSLLSPQHG